MNRMKSWLGKRTLLVGLATLLALLGLSSCFRGYGHGRYDPARFDERMDEFQAHVADELEIKPYQQADFDALSAKQREVIREWRNGWHETALEVQRLLEQEPQNPDGIAAALKLQIRRKPSDETLERMIDETVAFYRTLEPEQQERIRERMQKVLRWRLG